MILVYALAAFAAGTGVLIDARDELTFAGELLLGAGGALLVAWIAVWSDRAWIWPAGVIILAAAGLLRDVPSGGVSGSEALRSVATIGALAAAVAAILLWEHRKKRRQSPSGESA